MKNKKTIIIASVLGLVVISAFFVLNKAIQEKNKDYCLKYNFENCPESKCYSGHCSQFSNAKSACCPSGLFD